MYSNLWTMAFIVCQSFVGDFIIIDVNYYINFSILSYIFPFLVAESDKYFNIEFLYPVILSLIIKEVSSFKQPYTRSVHRDIIKAVFHFKVQKQHQHQIQPLLFTLLASTFLLCILEFLYLLIHFKKYFLTDTKLQYSLILILIIYALLLFLSRKLKYQSTLIFALVIIILEILGIQLLVGIAQFRFALAIYLFVPIYVIIFCLVFTVPQYQIILRSIDIKNLDFASSYQQFPFIMISTTVSYLMYNKSDVIFQGITIWLPMNNILWSSWIQKIFLQSKLIINIILRARGLSNLIIKYYSYLINILNYLKPFKLSLIKNLIGKLIQTCFHIVNVQQEEWLINLQYIIRQYIQELVRRSKSRQKQKKSMYNSTRIYIQMNIIPYIFIIFINYNKKYDRGNSRQIP
ncbi:hypothetical protein pb186bvf_009197 [Paramecium bursaria]